VIIKDIATACEGPQRALGGPGCKFNIFGDFTDTLDPWYYDFTNVVAVGFCAQCCSRIGYPIFLCRLLLHYLFSFVICILYSLLTNLFISKQ